MEKKWTLLLVAAIVAILILPLFVNVGSSGADTVIYGTVYTEEGNQEAVAVDKGKIVYVGSETGARQYIGPNTKVINVGDKFVMPGFSDCHAHPYKMFEGIDCGIDVSLAFSVEDVIVIVKQYVAQHPDLDVYYGFGWMESFFEGDVKTKETLDIATTKPLALCGINGHEMWCNSAFTEKTEVDKRGKTPDPPGGVIVRDPVTGEPTGCFKESAMDIYVYPHLPVFTVEQYCQAILDAQDYYLSMGYTSYMEMMLNNQYGSKDNHNLLKAYEKLDREGLLKINVKGGWGVYNDVGEPIPDIDMVAKLAEETKGGNFEITSVKFFLDGVVEGHTAYLMKDYADEEGYRGVSAWRDSEGKLMTAVDYANKMGLIAHFHAIGDQAVQLAIEATAYSEIHGHNNCHNVITHLQIFSEQQAKAMAELGMVAAANLSWGFKMPGYYNEIEVKYLGEERASNMYPLKYLVDNNVPIGFATDYPAGLIGQPMICMSIAVTRTVLEIPELQLGPEHALSREMAIHAMTYGGVSQMGFESKGMIKVGMDADIIVVDHNLLTCSIWEMTFSENLMTMVNGEILYQVPYLET